METWQQLFYTCFWGVLRGGGSPPRHAPETPRWLMGDVQFESGISRPMTLIELRSIPELKEMFLLRKGMRLSVQPDTEAEFLLILALANDCVAVTVPILLSKFILFLE